MKILKNKSGFSLVEILLAICIFAIFTIGIAYLSLDTLDRDSRATQSNEALFYAQDGIEAVRNIRDKNYLFLTNGDHGLNFENNKWSFGLAPEIVDDFYERTVTISDVYRDADGNISTEGDIFDPDTKKVDIKIEWLQKGVIPRSATLTEYISNWRGDDWITTTCEEFNTGIIDQTVVQDTAGPPENNCGVILAEIEAESEFYSSADVGKHGYDVDVDGNYAYLATNDDKKGLNVINVTNRSAPTIISSLDISGKGKYVKKDGNYAYVSTNDPKKGLAIVDVTNPASPISEKNIDMGYEGNGMDIKDNYLYMGIDKISYGFLIYDVTSKTAPVLKDSIDFSDAVHTVKIDGNDAYVGLYDDNTGLRVLDISNPLSVTQISSLGVGEEVNTIAISGNLLFLGTETEGGGDDDGSNSLKVVDVSNPQQPVLLTSVNTGGEIQDLTISGSYLYAAIDRPQSGLAAVNISNPYSPYLAYTMDIGGKGMGIDSDENYVYVATDTANRGLVIVGTALTDLNTNGTYTSNVFDTGSNDTTYNFIEWDYQAVAGGSIKFQIKTASTSEELESATWVGSDGTNTTYYEIPRTIITLDDESTGNRYFQYKAFLTSDGSSTPTLHSVRINYTP